MGGGETRDVARDTPLRLSVFGATGSIGRSTLDLVARAPEGFRVEVVAGGRNATALAQAARRVGARHAVIADPSGLGELRAALSGTGITSEAGEAAVIEAASRPADMMVAAIVGAAGLRPTLEAARHGTTIALANKECLVCAGELFLAAVAAGGTRILPVDSEHSAIFQVFERQNFDQIEKLTLTASGGPFRTLALEEMRRVSPADALRHPNWSMGARISVDSATMMNKGFEIIEARHLFALDSGRIDVLVHPQSIVHGMVHYRDGSVLAQLGTPDMRAPIAHCLAWPGRMPTPCERLDLAALATLSFEAPDPVRFPALRLAREALAEGTAATAALNAADEVLVAAFLAGRIGFLDIAAMAERTLEQLSARGLLARPRDIGDVLGVDGAARAAAAALAGTAGN